MRSDIVSAGKIDVGTLAELLHETEQHHGNYEKTHGKHNSVGVVCAVLERASQRQNPEEAAAVAGRYMEKK